MLEMTCGLLTIDENESLFLAHEIVHDFLSARLHDINHFDSVKPYSKNKIIRMDGLNPSHIAALLGIPPLLEILITQATREARQSNQPGFFESLIDSRNAFGNTPLLYAVKQRQFAVAKILLQTNAVNPSIMDNTIIRWTLGWGNEELIRLMVRMPKFNKQLARRQFGKRIEMYLDEDTRVDERRKYYESIGYPRVRIPNSTQDQRKLNASTNDT